jgi:type II secretory pathway pseudopilin PulG
MNRRHSMRLEAGESLIELLVTISIMAVSVVVLVSGMAAGIRAADVNRKQAVADAAVRNDAESLKDRNTPWNSSGSYTLPAVSGYTVSLNSACWNGDNPTTFSPCPSGDRGLQRLTITVTANSGRASESVTVLKRRT